MKAAGERRRSFPPLQQRRRWVGWVIGPVLPLGGINYTRVLKGLLPPSQEHVKRAGSRDIALFLFHALTSDSFSSQTFPHSLPEWKREAFLDVTAKLQWPPSFPLPPLMTNVFPVQKHMLPFKEAQRKLLGAVTVFVLAGGGSGGNRRTRRILPQAILRQLSL